MAELAGNQLRLAHDDGGLADRTILLALRNVATGDTVDLASWFSVVKTALFMAKTASRQGVCQAAGTVVTIPTAGLSGDAGYLLAEGPAG